MREFSANPAPGAVSFFATQGRDGAVRVMRSEPLIIACSITTAAATYTTG